MDTGESALHFWDYEFFDFENRAPIGAFARAPARSKLGEMLKKWSKIIKKSKKIDFFKKNILWINVPGSSSNVLGMFSAHLWPVKCSEVIWHWWKVFQQFHQQTSLGAQMSFSKILKNLEVIFNSLKIITIFILHQITSEHFGTLYRSQMGGKHA